MVSGIAVRMEIALEYFKESLEMYCTSAELVLIHDDRSTGIAAGSVKLHIAFALMFLAGLVQHLQGGFVSMENFSF